MQRSADADGLTVQLTPRGEWLELYVVRVDPSELVVREAGGKSGSFDYLVQGVRQGYEHHATMRDAGSTDVVPAGCHG